MMKKILISGSLRVGSVLFAILASSILARYLTTKDFSNFGTANSASVILGTLLLFGYQLSVVKFFAIYGAGHKAKASAYLGNAVVVTLAMGLACLLAFTVIYALSGKWVFDDFGISHHAAIAAIVLLIVMRSFAVLVGEALRGLGRVGLAATVSGLGTFGGLLSAGCFLVAIFCASYFNVGAALVNIVHIASACYVVAVCFGLWCLHRSGIAPRFEPRNFFPSMRRDGRENVNLALAQVLQLALGGQAAIVIGSFASLDATLGNLIIAQQIQAILIAPLTLVNGTISNRIVKLHSEGRQQDLEDLLRKGATIAFWATLPAVLFIVLFGRWGLPALFGAQYAASYYTVIIICAGALFNAYTGAVAMALALLGLDRVYLRIVALIAVLGISAYFLAAKLYGTIGLSVGVSVLMIVQNLFLVLAVKKHLEVASVAILSPRALFGLAGMMVREARGGRKAKGGLT